MTYANYKKIQRVRTNCCCLLSLLTPNPKGCNAILYLFVVDMFAFSYAKPIAKSKHMKLEARRNKMAKYFEVKVF